jgi:hypothetical protein
LLTSLGNKPDTFTQFPRFFDIFLPRSPLTSATNNYANDSH